MGTDRDTTPQARVLQRSSPSRADPVFPDETAGTVWHVRVDGLSPDAAHRLRGLIAARGAGVILPGSGAPGRWLWVVPHDAFQVLRSVTGVLSGEDARALASVDQAIRNHQRAEFILPCPLRHVPIGPRTLVMGILNVTPDSFSDGGKYLDAGAAVQHGSGMARDGADIIDIGAESTRPGAAPVDAEEELRRLLPVIRGLRNVTDRLVSVDTSKARVADATLKAGAHLINDVTALHGDPDMGGVVAAHGAPIVLMHMRGTPRTMQQETRYDDLIDEIYRFLDDSIGRAIAAGVREEAILVDPGIGFAKSREQNLEILRRLGEFRSLGRPILVGPSRKSFIGLTLGVPPGERVFGTAAAAAIAAWNGAHVLRVHDVKPMRQVLDLADAIRSGLALGPDRGGQASAPDQGTSRAE